MVDLVPEFYIGDLRVDDYPFSVHRGEGGLNLGAGENIVAAVASRILDGEIRHSGGTANRTLVLPLYVEGADLAELADNEATLIRACERQRNTFTLDPGDGYGLPTVFDTFRIQAVHARNDIQEAALMRRWDLAIPALPWARSPERTTVTFTGSAASATERDACASTTGWSATNGAAVTATTWSGDTSVKVTVASSSNVGISITRAGTIAEAYIGIDLASTTGFYVNPATSGWNPDGSYPDPLRLDGLLPVAIEPRANGVRRFWFANNGASSHALSVYIFATGSNPDLYIAGVYSASAPPGLGLALIPVPGSVRGPASIQVTKASGTLSNPTIYVDPTMTTWNPAVKASWPEAPAGQYFIHIFGGDTSLVGAAPGDVFVATVTSGGRTQTARTVPATGYSSNSRWISFGPFDIAGNRSGKVGSITATYTRNGTPKTMSSGHERLFRRAQGETALTHIASTAVARPLILDAPSIDYPMGGLWSNDVDISDSAAAWEDMVFQPGVQPTFIATDADPDLSITLDMFAYYHTYNSGS